VAPAGSTMTNGSNNLGSIVKQQRVMAPLTLKELAAKSGVSLSYLGQIERGKRFPSVRILRKIFEPFCLGENELFIFAGYLSPQLSTAAEGLTAQRLDPYVTAALSQEPLEIQRIALGILSILKSMTKDITQQNSGNGTD